MVFVPPDAGVVVRVAFQTPQLPPVAEVHRHFAASEAAGWFSNNGPCARLLAERLSARLGGLHCVPVANGTLALMVALRAGGARAGGEVLMPSLTFAAAGAAVRWAGLSPVFVDVDPEAWHMDPDALDAAIEARGDRAVAILAASTFGTPPSPVIRRRWEAAARTARVPLIVDSAAGLGAIAEDGMPLGGQGDVEIFSLHATKPFAIGEGGLVVTRHEAVAHAAACLANFGLCDGVVTGAVGLNAKLAEWPAATGLAVLERFDDILAARRATAAAVLDAALPLGFSDQATGGERAWQFVPLAAPTPAVAENVAREAAAADIGVRLGRGFPLHRMPAFAAVERADALHVTEDLAERLVLLPMANRLPPGAVQAIAACLRRAGSSP